jgi:hypothetical protein
VKVLGAQLSSGKKRMFAQIRPAQCLIFVVDMEQT